jgi:hypothetical protein
MSDMSKGKNDAIYKRRHNDQNELFDYLWGTW